MVISNENCLKSIKINWALFAIIALFVIPIQAQNTGFEWRSIAWSPDGTRIALGGGSIYCGQEPDVDKSLFAILILDANTGQQVNSFNGHVCAVNSGVWNSDGTRLASAGNDGRAIVWDTLTGQRIIEFQDAYGRGASVTGLAWSPDDQSLAHYIDLGRSPLIIWNANTGQTVKTFVLEDGVESLAWSPDGSKVAVGDFYGSIQILDIVTEQIVNTFEVFSQDGRITSVAWSPDGSKLAASGIGLNILGAETGQVLTTMRGHDGNSTIFVSWSSDGRKLASVGGLDNTVRVWDTDSGLELGAFPSQSLQLFSVAWSPDGTQLAFDDVGNKGEITIVTPAFSAMPTPTATSSS